MNVKTALVAILIPAVVSACQSGVFQSQNQVPSALSEIAAVRLNYRFEADVPGPVGTAKAAEERNTAVQTDFDQARPQEILDKSVFSPDKKRILAVYHRTTDVAAEFRLDMYSGDGKLLRKITPETMAVHFPDTIVWSPDSTSAAFVAMLRASQETGIAGQQDTADQAKAVSNSATANTANETKVENSNVAVEPPAADTSPAAPTPAAPAGVLTFRSEQIYLCGPDGEGARPITQNEGLIYFYYVWSPDSSTLASLAATAREWQYLQYQADAKGETFVPLGRPRIIEKNGRERRLDDALTNVYPVWSPDSSKVADAFETQVRIYDAAVNNPTQAAIPLRNPLLISSQAFDRDQQTKLQSANTNADGNSQVTPPAAADSQPVTTLPDEKSLVSFNPIVDLEWTQDDILYLQTAYVKRMKNEADSVSSFARWHRVIFTPQPAALTR